MGINMTREAYYVLDTLEKAGFEAYLVGGCVRDFLLGKIPLDYDITTNALPEKMKEVFKYLKTIDIGIAHGTVGVLVNSQVIEVTTYRVDGEYLDSRHPSTVTFATSLKEDLSRRDFTINAMASSKNGDIIDFFEGKKDIQNKLIRAVGDPYKRFAEDALRILRGLRFASVLGFDIEKNTAKAINECFLLLGNISKERINIELNKLLLGVNVKNVITDYRLVINYIIPELGLLDSDCYQKMANLVAISPNDLVIRLALLLKDLSTTQVLDTLKSLKYDKKTTQEVRILHEYQHENITANRIDLKLLLNQIGLLMLGKLIKIRKTEAVVISREEEKTYKTIENELASIISAKECYQLADLNIDGSDLSKFGIKGIETGVVLNQLLHAVIHGNCENEINALIRYVKKQQ